MKMIIAAVILGLGTALAAGAASAAPAGGFGSAVPQADAGLIKVHGIHSTCERGPAGWHRSPRKGVRIECRPRRPSGLYWSWRKTGPNWGWYHTREKRWH